MASYTILERNQHEISRSQFSEYALKVLYRLHANQFDALLVGGALRDLLRGRAPRDFDVVTNASIEEIQQLFRNSKVVGKRFPIVHCYFGSTVIEISSLKTSVNHEEAEDRFQRIAQDASRRDYTVNAIYYDIENFQLLDPLGALEDLKNNHIVPIGEPTERIQEDPIRILRAMKLKAIHGMEYGPGLRESILANRDTIRNLGPGRKYEELTRVFLDDDVEALLKEFQEFGLTGYFWPAGSMLVNEKGPKFFAHMRDSLTISSSRGSFSRSSHVMLWFRLFIQSGVFDPGRNSAQKSKDQFTQFIEPLGMPFRNPVYDALHAITVLFAASKGRQSSFETTSEVTKLVEYYAQVVEPQLKKFFRDVIRTGSRSSNRKRGNRKVAGRSEKSEAKGKPESKAKPAQSSENKEDAAGRKRRRRRRRRRRPTSEPVSS